MSVLYVVISLVLMFLLIYLLYGLRPIFAPSKGDGRDVNKKYELLLEEYIELAEKKLYRIQALKTTATFEKGERGGYIEGYHNLSQTGKCWVAKDAKVYEKARIDGDALVSDKAVVFGECHINKNAFVKNRVKIYGKAVITDSAIVSEDAVVFENAKVAGKAKVSGKSSIYGQSVVFDNAQIKMSAQIFGSAKVGKNGVIMGDARVGGAAKIENRTILSGEIV